MSSSVRIGPFLALCATAVFAQTSGVPPEWEVQKQLSALTEHVQRLQPVLEQLKPQDWVSQGAPAAYTDQLNRTRAQIDYLALAGKELAAHPEKLTTALEALFRMQSLDAMLRSLEGGIRKYQNPAVADLLGSLIADTAADRDNLQQYIVELASDREQQFKVMDQEAQRCRAVLSHTSRGSGKAAVQKEDGR